ncbi:unnamed protein product [Pieris brassicae]|uniref:PDZ domain-containing protein n=1 Tax=Pieris brassicae TaxID=7116 RepID=A0A9P0TEQ3_PIEBR|nr:unnamed protein product [Pieris brassicae]
MSRYYVFYDSLNVYQRWRQRFVYVCLVSATDPSIEPIERIAILAQKQFAFNHATRLTRSTRKIDIVLIPGLSLHCSTGLRRDSTPSAMPMYQRPPFWRVPHQRRDPEDDASNYARKKVTPGTPAGRDLTRGDIIAKVDDYDARDLRHEDAQNLFKNAKNQIKLVVQRDSEREGPRGAPTHRSPIQNSVPPPFRTPSPKPGNAWRGPESLPRSTPLLQPQYSLQQEGEYRTVMLSPDSARNEDVVDESITSQGTTGDAVRDRTPGKTSVTMAVNPNFFPNGYQDPKHPDEEVVSNWPYRTTPLVLPGAKVRREPGPTESYLRHHPNPAMRAPPHHDYRDTLMRQKVAESVLQRVVGEDANKVVHKQFNSPINLYSEQNIANSIRQQTSPLPSNGYGRPHVVKRQVSKPYDPAKSDTYRVLQEQGLGDAHEVPTPQTKVFTAPATKQPVPPKISKEASQGKQTTFVNSLHEEHIIQSNAFKRLMYNVLGETEF